MIRRFRLTMLVCAPLLGAATGADQLAGARPGSALHQDEPAYLSRLRDALDGIPAAQTDVGRAALRMRDFATAFGWFERAAAQGYPAGEGELAALLATGRAGMLTRPGPRHWRGARPMPAIRSDSAYWARCSPTVWAWSRAGRMH